MVQIKIKNPFGRIQKKMTEMTEKFHNLPSKLNIEKRMDEKRVMKIGCDVITDIFNEETKVEKCDISFELDPEFKEKPAEEIGHINIHVGQNIDPYEKVDPPSGSQQPQENPPN